uniref:Protein transport protein Sec31A-like isoform X2 n=1 Tax=Hirondellea gigas TaxID=1518452 RepID=A0A6A7FXH9_9CRUS
MKVKEVNTTATISWSPSSVTAPHLACATASVHADPASKNDALQIYSLNLGEENLSMKLAGSISTDTRFHDVVWGIGGSQVEGGAGVVACAGNDGSIYVYNGEQVMTGGSKPLLTSMKGKHAGPVLCLDFNHHQANLLASGSGDCEVFIWDINDPSTPMSPGTKATLNADVTSVAWNRQVEHILASSYAGRCVVFDLRKSASIIQISDAVSMVKANRVCWHPSVATQLALCSGDDSTPVVQIWDLRFASSPVRQCDGHQRGIQSLTWCKHDPDMLCSSAKDNRVLCWSPSTGELLCEFPAYNQWSYEVSWSPRDPALVATASVDGFVSVFSLFGGGYAPPRDVKFSAIADSFPGMDMPAEAPTTVQPQHIYPRRPPAFQAAHAGCSFGFGGRLLSWHKGSRVVEVQQVVTEPQLVERSNQLLTALQNSHLQQYCTDKLAAVDKQDTKEVWQYISASLDTSDSSRQYLTLLGHPPPSPPSQQLSPQQEADNVSAQLGALTTADGGSTDSLDPSEQFEMIASAQSRDKTPELEVVERESSVSAVPRVLVSTDGAGADIRRAVITGRLEDAVELCITAGKHCLALVLAQHHGHHLYCKTRDRVLSLESDTEEVCGVVGAVVKADLDSVVMQCKLNDWREAVVTVITHAPQEQLTPLLQRIGNRLETGGELQAALICYLIARALDSFVQCWVKANNAGTAAPLSTQSLQELVEVILVLQQTADETTDSAAATQYIAEYASLLATQGALSTALQYLVYNAAADTQSELTALKDRLSQALGENSRATISARNRSMSSTSNSSFQQQQQAGYRRTSTPSASSFQAAQFTPSVQARQAAVAAAASSQPAPNFYQPTQPLQTQSFTAAPQPAAQFGGYQPLVPTPPAAVPPPAPPAATLSAPGGLRRTGGVSRYMANSSSSSNTSPAVVMQPTNSSSMMTTPTQQFQAFQPSSTTNSNLSSHQPLPPTFLDPSQLQSPPGSSLPSAVPPYAGSVPDSQQQQQQQAAVPAKPPAAYDPNVKRGWNDPPPLSTARRVKQQAAAAAAVAAAALSSSSTTAAAPAAVTPMVPTPQPPPHQQTFQGFQPTAAAGGGFGVTAPPPPPPLPAAAAPPQPIPIEAQIIHDVLNALYSRAVQSAPNMNVRQTFQSVGPKLEALYDKLRTSQVSPGTIQGLQSLVQCIQAGDYHRALQLHTQTVSAGNFSQMSPFMPAIKKLITTCMQCQIFLN